MTCRIDSKVLSDFVATPDHDSCIARDISQEYVLNIEEESGVMRRPSTGAA